MAFVSDTMTGTAGTALASHTGETGATWTLHPNGVTGAVLSNAGRVRGSTGSVSNLYYASGTPASADYTVEADFFVASLISGDLPMLCLRVQTAANTYYFARYVFASTLWQIGKVVTGTTTAPVGSTFTQTLVAGNTYHVKFTATGTALVLNIDGTDQISTTDSSISTAGKAGLRIQTAGSGQSDTTGIHIDNFTASDPVVAPPAGKQLLRVGRPRGIGLTGGVRVGR